MTSFANYVYLLVERSPLIVKGELSGEIGLGLMLDISEEGY